MERPPRIRVVCTVDGTRDRPPGKSAENWGRRDGIRAGAVSGPWRSAPREATSAPASPPAKPLATPERAPRAAAKVREPVAPVALPSTPSRGEMRDLEAYERARARRALATKAWLIFGLVAATLIVIAAVVFRPDHYLPAPAASTTSVAGVPEMPPPDESDVSAIPEPITAETAAPIPVSPQDHVGPVETVDAVEPTPAATGALAGVTSVRLRVGPDFPPERQQAIVAALTDAGVPQVRVETLPFEIATSRVGYYRAEDLSGAEALARLVSPIVDQGAELGVRDYGELLSNPEPGRLDLWVGS